MLLRASLILFLVIAGQSCSLSSTEPSPARGMRFDPAAYGRGDFYAVPWPSELRLKDGVVDLSALPARDSNYILSTYLPVLENRLRGFSPSGAILFYLDTTLDTATLPKLPQETLEEDAAIRLVNIEPESSRFGEAIPVEVRFSPFGGNFQPHNTLTLLPVGGFPMAPGERYAAIVLDNVRTPEGKLTLPEEVRAQFEEPSDSAFEALKGALPKLKIDTRRIAAVTAFRTADPNATVRQAHRILAGTPLPTAFDWSEDPYGTPCPNTFETTTYYLAQGKFTLPNFLKGPRPYAHLGSGIFVYDDEGAPIIQEHETVPFSLSIPSGAMPAGGFPVVIYQHGAGGNRHSFVRDGTACSMALRGIAVIAIDLPVHGGRNTEHDPVFLLVNPENVPAALDIESEGTIDLFSLARLIPQINVPADLFFGGSPAATLRSTDVGYIGHSQGSFVGVGFMAYETTVKAGILSGSGAHFITFITDRIAGQSIDMQLIFGVEGEAVQDGIAVLLGIPNEKPDRFHFLFTLIQTIADPIDPINYAPYVIRLGERPKHVYQSAGFLDSYDPPGVNETLAAALGLDVGEPLELDYPKLTLAGGKTIALPAGGNKTAGGKQITAINSQFPQGDHWVYLEDGIARTQGSDFMESALKEDVPTVPARCSWVGATLTCPY